MKFLQVLNLRMGKVERYIDVAEYSWWYWGGEDGSLAAWADAVSTRSTTKWVALKLTIVGRCGSERSENRSWSTIRAAQERRFMVRFQKKWISRLRKLRFDELRNECSNVKTQESNVDSLRRRHYFVKEPKLIGDWRLQIATMDSSFWYDWLEF